MADSRYVLLTEKHQDIESAYNKRLAELVKSCQLL